MTRAEKIAVRARMRHAARPGEFSGAANPMYGKKLSAERRAQISAFSAGEHNPFYGKLHTEETRARMREAHANRPPVVCPHCGKQGHLNTMKRWHFDNCRTIA